MKVMILAAGFGTRLKPLTLKTPKALVLVKKKPALYWIIQAILPLNPDLVIINTHYLADKIKDYLKNQNWPCRIKTIYEPKILGTGGGIINAQKFLSGGSALVYNVDILTDYDLRALTSLPFAPRTLAYLLCRQQPASSGLLLDEKNQLVGFFNQRTDLPAKIDKKIRRVAFCGIHFLSPEFWRLAGNFKPVVDCSIIDIYLKALQAGFKIQGVDIAKRRFLDIGNLQNLSLANSADFNIIN